jgi:hypothetical protein
VLQFAIAGSTASFYVTERTDEKDKEQDHFLVSPENTTRYCYVSHVAYFSQA